MRMDFVKIIVVHGCHWKSNLFYSLASCYYICVLQCSINLAKKYLTFQTIFACINFIYFL